MMTIIQFTKKLFKDQGGYAWVWPAVQAVAAVAGAKWANDTSKSVASDQMAFQEKMANTAHQRQVADLNAAGLNPTMSSNSGADSPGGAGFTSAQISLPDMMAYDMSLKQMELAEKKLALDGLNSEATRKNTITDTEIKQLKKVLMKKGMPRAQLEGTLSEFLGKALEKMKNDVRSPKLPSNPDRDTEINNWQY